MPAKNVEQTSVEGDGYSEFHTSCRSITGWAHMATIVVRGRINSRLDVEEGARGQSHSSHKQSSQSLLITRSMCVTSSSAFHCCLLIILSSSAWLSLPLSLSLFKSCTPFNSSLNHVIVCLFLTFGLAQSPPSFCPAHLMPKERRRDSVNKLLAQVAAFPPLCFSFQLTIFHIITY